MDTTAQHPRTRSGPATSSRIARDAGGVPTLPGRRSRPGRGLGRAAASALDRLATEFALHVEVTEGPDGLHQAILAGDLRLANQVAALAAEHGPIAARSQP